MRALLAEASLVSFALAFSGEQAIGLGDSGKPCYALSDLAEALGFPLEAAAGRLFELQCTFGAEFLVQRIWFTRSTNRRRTE